MTALRSVLAVLAIQAGCEPAIGSEAPWQVAVEAESTVVRAPALIRESADTDVAGGSHVELPADSGNAWSWHDGSDILDWSVSVPRPVRCLLWARLRSGPTGGSCFVQVDEAAPLRWNFDGDGTWRWHLVGRQDGAIPLILHLEAGEHRLRLRQRQAGIAVDALVLSEDISWVPSGRSWQPVFCDGPYGDLSSYQPSHPEHWTVTDDLQGGAALFLRSTDHRWKADHGLGTVTLLRDAPFADFELKARARSPEDLAENRYPDYAIVFAYDSEDRYAYLSCNARMNDSGLCVVDGGRRHLVAHARRSLIRDNGWHQLRLQRHGDTVHVFQDDEHVVTARHPVFAQTGRIGFGSHNDAACFDDVEIAELVHGPFDIDTLVLRGTQPPPDAGRVEVDGRPVELLPDGRWEAVIPALPRGSVLLERLDPDGAIEVRELHYQQEAQAQRDG